MNCAGMNTEYSLCSLEVKRAEAIDSAQQWACVFILFMHFSGYHCGWLTRWRWVCVCVCVFQLLTSQRARVVHEDVWQQRQQDKLSLCKTPYDVLVLLLAHVHLFNLFLSLSYCFPVFIPRLPPFRVGPKILNQTFFHGYWFNLLHSKAWPIRLLFNFFIFCHIRITFRSALLML